ncbi:MAG: HEAT repeat domain-containing protein [Chloroflexota bacterium]
MEVLGDAGAVPGLLDALQDESPYVRMTAARALGKLGDAAALSGLLAALEDPEFIVRQNAMWSLGELGAGAKDAVPTLQALAADTSHFPSGELTVGELAGLSAARIELAVEAAKAPAPAEEAAAEEVGEEEAGAKPRLSAEERKARREAALARKKAAEGGGEAEARPKLSAEERQARREAALARKKAREEGEG